LKGLSIDLDSFQDMNINSCIFFLMFADHNVVFTTDKVSLQAQRIHTYSLK